MKLIIKEYKSIYIDLGFKYFACICSHHLLYHFPFLFHLKGVWFIFETLMSLLNDLYSVKTCMYRGIKRKKCSCFLKVKCFHNCVNEHLLK